MRETGEWGEFFPMSISPFGYNETLASEYYPLSEEELKKFDGKWRDQLSHDKHIHTVQVLPISQYTVSVVGEHQAQANISDILNNVLLCSKTGKPYKILPQELGFYIEHGLPLPLMCPDARHLDRFTRKNDSTIWERKCDKCQSTVHTSFKPNRPEIVYCEECYKAEIL